MKRRKNFLAAARFLPGVTALAVLLLCLVPTRTFAAGTTESVPGVLYEFGEDEHYPFSTAAESTPTSSGGALGTFRITGDVLDEGEVFGIQTYTVSSGNLSFSYNFRSAILGAADTEWHLASDGSKIIDSYSTESNIKKGAILVQSSLDGMSWNTDVEMTDVFKDTDTLSGSLYTTRDLQQENGCYYRVIVAYELAVKTGEESVAFFFTQDVIETKKVCEVYSFYVKNSVTEGVSLSSHDTPRLEIAGTPVNTGKDNGYSGSEAIGLDDPHFGWTLGTFIINGYTREVEGSDPDIFLKNVGDKVTLWFSLNEDITCLNGDSTLSINEDTNGYNQEFGISRTNFGYGTLIISYTDYEGRTHEPICYTDFLRASVSTAADTQVQIFEEGDYTVELDYEIKSNPRQLGPVSVLPSYTNYKIEFSFSIRNGNCMVYPFDLDTGAELSDGDITAAGFQLDMAKSRYLNIDVTRTVLTEGSDGLLTEDERFNRPAKDGESYTDEGIYVFTVTNVYTGSTTTKTLYVGTDPNLMALSQDNLSVELLNEYLAGGYVVEEDGSLINPDKVVTVPVPETGTEDSAGGETGETSAEDVLPSGEAESGQESGVKGSGTLWPAVLIVLAIAAILCGIVVMDRRKKREEEEEKS